MQSVKSVKVTTLAGNVVYDGRLLGQFGFFTLLQIKDNNGEELSVMLKLTAHIVQRLESFEAKNWLL